MLHFQISMLNFILNFYYLIIFSVATYGGSNMGILRIVDPNSIYSFCQNCNYSNTSFPENTYQNEYGFASGIFM